MYHNTGLLIHPFNSDKASREQSHTFRLPNAPRHLAQRKPPRSSSSSSGSAADQLRLSPEDPGPPPAGTQSGLLWGRFNSGIFAPLLVRIGSDVKYSQVSVSPFAFACRSEARLFTSSHQVHLCSSSRLPGGGVGGGGKRFNKQVT